MKKVLMAFLCGLLGAAAPFLVSAKTAPVRKVLQNNYHVWQTFNNCAPAALSMTLSYYDIRKSQETLADELRPYHNRRGINDDKSTPPDELAEKAKEYGLVAYYRSNGTIELLKRFVANGLPVVVRTRLDTGHDYAHYRVVKGYDDLARQIIQNDSYQGKNLRYSYETFEKLWQPFNYEYLVLASPEKEWIVKKILGEETDPAISWRKAVNAAEQKLAKDPTNTDVAFNLSVSLYYTGDYKRSAAEFEKIESLLPMRTLWYRIEPIQAYFALENYARVFALSDTIFANRNRAFSELYLLRGKSYLAQGDAVRAKEELQKAVLYNKNLKAAREALASMKAN
ncbi:MAG: C39 family peptidase [Candidatus Sungbacteria bacterium]|nr:C39 family peptidase [Candidatus Sungbacteria bacterium]